MKLTLEKAWQLCLEQRKWITKEVRKKNHPPVSILKRKWASAHGYEDICVGCFFCEYNKQKSGHVFGYGCVNCPGKLVDPEFDCKDVRYHFYNKPIKFHNKLLELNEIRLQSKPNRQKTVNDMCYKIRKSEEGDVIGCDCCGCEVPLATFGRLRRFNEN